MEPFDLPILLQKQDDELAVLRRRDQQYQSVTDKLRTLLEKVRVPLLLFFC